MNVSVNQPRTSAVESSTFVSCFYGEVFSEGVYCAFKEALERNPILMTALNPIIGYEKAAFIAKKAYAERRVVLDVAESETDLTLSELKKFLDPTKLTQGGIE